MVGLASSAHRTCFLMSSRIWYDSNAELGPVTADLDRHRFHAGQRLEGDRYGQRLAHDVIAELLDCGTQFGTVGDDADLDAVGELAAHLLAAIVDRAGKLAGRSFAHQVLGQFGGKHDDAGLALGRRPACFGLEPHLDVVGVKDHGAVGQREA